MKSKHWPEVLLLTYLISFLYCLYIGVFETIYSLGIYVLIAIQGIGLVFFLIHLLATRFLSKTKFEVGKSFRFSVLILVFIQILWIVAHRIEKYVPTYTISIPETFTGCVYLFISPEERGDVDVSNNGIGYMGSEGKAQWRILRGGIDISDAYSGLQTNSISVYSKDGLQLTKYRIECFEINDSNFYPERSSDYPIDPCMNDEEFLQLSEGGYIDESNLKKVVWNRSENRDEWIPNFKSSRVN